MVYRDFNLEPTKPVMMNFTDSQNFINLIENNACLGVGSCIDLILTDREYFKNTSFDETGISDHHHLIFLIMKTTLTSEVRLS